MWLISLYVTRLNNKDTKINTAREYKIVFKYFVNGLVFFENYKICWLSSAPNNKYNKIIKQFFICFFFCKVFATNKRKNNLPHLKPGNNIDDFDFKFKFFGNNKKRMKVTKMQ